MTTQVRRRATQYPGVYEYRGKRLTTYYIAFHDGEGRQVMRAVRGSLEDAARAWVNEERERLLEARTSSALGPETDFDLSGNGQECG